MLEKTVLILAAGQQTRWEQVKTLEAEYKQLLEVKDETILARIVRQSLARGVEPMLVTIHDALAQAVNVPVIQPEFHRWTVETLLNCVWGERTIVLLGDTIYSRTVMDRVFNCSDPLRVFGNEFEIYAVSFSYHVKDEVVSALAKAILHAMEGGPGKLRKFYQAYCGIDLDSDKMENTILDRVCYIQDYTKDIDTPQDWYRFYDRVIRGELLDDHAR